MDNVIRKGVTGKQLITMHADELEGVLGMTPAAAKLFMSRYMSWITSRMDRAPSKGKKRRKGRSSNTSTPAKATNQSFTSPSTGKTVTSLPGGGQQGGQPIQPPEGKV